MLFTKFSHSDKINSDCAQTEIRIRLDVSCLYDL